MELIVDFHFTVTILMYNFGQFDFIGEIYIKMQSTPWSLEAEDFEERHQVLCCNLSVPSPVSLQIKLHERKRYIRAHTAVIVMSPGLGSTAPRLMYFRGAPKS